MANNNIRLIKEHRILIRADIEQIKQTQVTLISGGGSGHEPAHSGFIGDGCLSAAVCGDVFSSPTQDAVLEAIRQCAGPHGTLLIVKNYTGDKLNFGLAAEVARTEGFKVDMVIVADDVALLDNNDNRSLIGARGIAGTVFVHKFSGAAAKSGKTLAEVTELARQVAQGVKTMGVGLTPCIIPAVGKATFALESDEMEVGLGIHGEPGVSKQKLQTSDKLVDQLIDHILPHLAFKDGNKQAVALLNNLGSTTNMEMSVIVRHVIERLSKSGIALERLFVAPLMTSLEMAGVSISVLPLSESVTCQLLDQPTLAPAWPHNWLHKPHRSADEIYFPMRAKPAQSTEQVPDNNIDDHSWNVLISGTKKICNTLIENSQLLTDMDKTVGDGDLGINLESASKEVLVWLSTFGKTSPSNFLKQLALKVRQCLGGTSGPLYALFLIRASQLLADVSLDSWTKAFEAGLQGIKGLGGAQEGDRTMIDALEPALRSFKASQSSGKNAQEALKNAADAAHEGAEKTKQLIARRGRSTYLRERVLGHPDPGAYAVYVILKSLDNAK
jgi:dihydroxyacetone kinase